MSYLDFFRWHELFGTCQDCQRSSHYNDVIMSALASQITSLTIVYSTVYSHTDQRKHQSSASLAFGWGIHRGPVNSPHQWPVTRKSIPFDDAIMTWLIRVSRQNIKIRNPKMHLLRVPPSRTEMFSSAKLNHISMDEYVATPEDFNNILLKETIDIGYNFFLISITRLSHVMAGQYQFKYRYDTQ